MSVSTNASDSIEAPEANEVIRAIEARRSVRAYRPDPVPEELVRRVIDAGIWAPSGMNRQSAIVLAVTDRRLRDRLAEANRKVMGAPEGTDPFYGAPVVLAVLADASVPTHVEDGALALGNMMLAASALGLGSCWIHRAREVFGTPEFKGVLADMGIDAERYVGVGHCILGYPDGPLPEPHPRSQGRVFWAR